MEFIQDLLTAAINFTALAGFGGIAAHAMWKHHTNWRNALGKDKHMRKTAMIFQLEQKAAA